MLKFAVQVMRWRDTRAHRPAICTRNISDQLLQAVALTMLITHAEISPGDSPYIWVSTPMQ